jgi:hypothetical protein
MTTLKLLSREGMAAIRSYVDVSQGLHVEALKDLLSHIAALEADNAALVAWINSWGHAAFCPRTDGRSATCAAKCAAKDVLAASHPGAALLEEHRTEVEGLRAFCEAFAVTAEDAVANAERPKGGQHVPFHGDFVNLPPSGVARLRWWAREARSALNGEAAALLTRTRNEGLEKAATQLEAESNGVGTDEKVALRWAAKGIRALKEPES